MFVFVLSEKKMTPSCELCEIFLLSHKLSWSSMKVVLLHVRHRSGQGLAVGCFGLTRLSNIHNVKKEYFHKVDVALNIDGAACLLF